MLTRAYRVTFDANLEFRGAATDGCLRGCSYVITCGPFDDTAHYYKTIRVPNTSSLVFVSRVLRNCPEDYTHTKVTRDRPGNILVPRDGRKLTCP